eukprot:scaffold19910_cov51-Attheya_sp.AAC.1
MKKCPTKINDINPRERWEVFVIRPFPLHLRWVAPFSSANGVGRLAINRIYSISSLQIDSRDDVDDEILHVRTLYRYVASSKKSSSLREGWTIRVAWFTHWNFLCSNRSSALVEDATDLTKFLKAADEDIYERCCRPKYKTAAERQKIEGERKRKADRISRARRHERRSQNNTASEQQQPMDEDSSQEKTNACRTGRSGTRPTQMTGMYTITYNAATQGKWWTAPQQ